MTDTSLLRKTAHETSAVYVRDMEKEGYGIHLIFASQAPILGFFTSIPLALVSLCRMVGAATQLFFENCKSEPNQDDIEAFKEKFYAERRICFINTCNVLTLGFFGANLLFAKP